MMPPSPRRLKQAAWACRRAFSVALLFSLGVNLLMLTAPLYMLQVFDRVLTSRSIDTLLLLSAIALAALIVLAALDALRGVVMGRTGAWLERRLGGTVLAGGIAGALNQAAPGSSQGLRDLGQLRGWLGGPGPLALMDSPWVPVFVAAIFLLHPILGWVALGGALALLVLALMTELTTRGATRAAGGAQIEAVGRADAALRNADVAEAMGMTPSLVGRWRAKNDESLSAQRVAGRWSVTISATSKLTRLALQVGMLGVGAWLVVLGEITPGAMIAATILASRALAPVEQAIGSWRYTVAARAAWSRLKALLREMPERISGMPLPAPTGRISVEGATYAHPGSSEPVLRNIAFGLAPGESLGLIGPTAAGKTTLARLLVGTLAARAGHVRLDGMDVAAWDPDDRGRHVGYLPQDVELFAGTVRENIARMGEGDPDAVVEAARTAGAHEMILRLPQGYDTEIGAGGMALSGGQRQRIALARAVYGNPKLVVLDEPNASLDAEGEEALMGALRRLREAGVTTVTIAHRPSILRRVDRILVLKDGAVQAIGTPDEIIPKLTAPRMQPATAGMAGE